jgi:predicted alpha/beta-hydrolase family hydrolase
VASLSAAGAAGPGRRYAALVCLSYPLHRPGAPETARERTAHWPRIGIPVLLLSGTSDPFARLHLLESSVRLLPDGRLETFPGLGHTLAPVRERALDLVAAFLRALPPPSGVDTPAGDDATMTR